MDKLEQLFSSVSFSDLKKAIQGIKDGISFDDNNVIVDYARKVAEKSGKIEYQFYYSVVEYHLIKEAAFRWLKTKEKIENNKKIFTLYFKSGKSNVFRFTNIIEAIKTKFDEGELDFWCYGAIKSYKWDKFLKRWKKI